MWLIGGGGLHPIVCISNFSLLTASTTTICRSQRSFLHPLSVATISSRPPAASSSYSRSVLGRAFATYTTSPRPSTSSCFQRSPLAIQLSTSFASFRMASTLALPKFPLFDAISRHDPNSTAVAHCLSGRSFKYGELLPDVCRARDHIYQSAGKTDIRGERIAFLVENSYDYVGTKYIQRRTWTCAEKTKH